MQTIWRATQVNGIPVLLRLINGIAQEDDGTPGVHERASKEDRGRFWLLDEDGHRTEIRVMRELFTPRFGERVWVLLCQDRDGCGPARYAVAGHVGDDDAVSVIRKELWRKNVLMKLAPQHMRYFPLWLSAAHFAASMGLICILALLPAGSATRALLAAGGVIAALGTALYFAYRFNKEVEDVLSPAIRDQLREVAQQLYREQHESNLDEG